MSEAQAGILGILAGTIITSGMVFCFRPDIRGAEVFQRENKPAVMRMHRVGRDGIYVADLKFKGNYFRPLCQYLKKIENESDRQIEEITMKKLVGWYE